MRGVPRAAGDLEARLVVDLELKFGGSALDDLLRCVRLVEVEALDDAEAGAGAR